MGVSNLPAGMFLLLITSAAAQARRDGRPPDQDQDGLPDYVEDRNHNGVVDPDETDPFQADTDSDGLPDGVEDLNHNGRVDFDETDPLNPDTDADARPDGVELLGEIATDPLDPDTDHDGLADGIEDIIQTHPNYPNPRIEPPAAEPFEAVDPCTRPERVSHGLEIEADGTPAWVVRVCPD